MRDAIILQQSNSNEIENGIAFSDMLRLSFQRHASYAAAYKMDYVCQLGDYLPDRGVYTGAWHKIKMIMDALDKGYKYVFWLDTDAAIVDFNADLRDAFTDKYIGCCEHKTEKFPKEWQIDTHLNVGVTFVKSGEGVREFIQEWWDSYPGHKRWLEQGSFNELAKKYPEIVFKMDDKYNATVNVNMCEKPVVVGWHGIMPVAKRFALMRQEMMNDHIKFRV